MCPMGLWIHVKMYKNGSGDTSVWYRHLVWLRVTLLCFAGIAFFFLFLQIWHLCQPHVEHAFGATFSAAFAHLMSLSHLGNSSNISEFFIIIMFVMVICEWWSSVLVLQNIWLLEGSDDGYHFLSRKNFFWEAAPCGLWEGKYFFWYMKIYYYCAFIIRMYELGLSFLLLYKVKTDTLATLITLKWTPGMSPIACSLWPKPATRTSSFSSIKFKQPSLSIKAVIFFFFLTVLD